MPAPEKTSFGVCLFRITLVTPITVESRNQNIPIIGSIAKNNAAT